MKHYVSSKAICPFYKHENRNVIYCEGIKEGTVIHIAFANPHECIEYKKQNCRCGNFKQCPVYNMLLDTKYNTNID
jgi:hypothetical protein